MREPPRLSDLSTARQVLVRLLQSLNFGQIQSLVVRNADPVFDPPPAVLVDVKLDCDEAPRPEVDLRDFALHNKVQRLLAQMDRLKNGTIERIEVREGIPCRLVIACPVTDAPR